MSLSKTTEEAQNSITQTILMANGEEWTVRLRGDCLEIIDANGNICHKSRKHITTGIYLAIQLASNSVG